MRKIKGKVKATGEVLTLTSYGYGYMSATTFYHKNKIKLIEVLLK